MPEYEIRLKPSAILDLDRMRRYDATIVVDGLERFLLHDPRQESKSRIKRLRGLEDPEYRLRLGDYRVFYNVDEAARKVDVLRILHKDDTGQYDAEVQQ